MGGPVTSSEWHCRSKEFTFKIGLVMEEADETRFWLELLVDSGLVKPSRLEPLTTEADGANRHLHGCTSHL
ncbi:MAG: four helix bundle protein [Terriglobales bacterium]